MVFDDVTVDFWIHYIVVAAANDESNIEMDGSRTTFPAQAE
jgi:hypothetical protein